MNLFTMRSSLSKLQENNSVSSFSKIHDLSNLYVISFNGKLGF